jgi:mannose-6-phosphate isomerase-like protein (cupin superfamily)
MKEPPATAVTDSPLPWLSKKHEERSGIMVDQEVFDSQLKRDRFPFPSEGDITLAVRNANYTLGPVMLHLVMKPGAVVPAHSHKGMSEALYVVEGDFTNEGKQYEAGTSLHFKAGNVHGPHTTKSGCKLLILWTERTSHESADLSDFIVAKAAA